jgi:acyl carrier protein
MKDLIRHIVYEHARFTPQLTLGDHDDLYQAGMTSHASVNVMLALEDRLDIVFPDHMLRRSVFGTISSLQAAIEELTAPR